MSPGTLDAVLNFTIPVVVIFGMLVLIYRAAKEPIDQFVGWIKQMIESSKEATDGAPVLYNEIIYE